MSETQEPRTQANIMIVDDTPANLQVLTGMLKGRGFRVRPLPNGRLALQAAAHEPPDLLLLDIMMPEMDGYEVCRRLKDNERLKDVPVIFLSALNETMDKVKAFSVGGVDYVTKPFQFEEVHARVETHLKIRRLQMELEDRNRQLRESYEQLNSLSAQKDEFVRIASHDLKNPLTCILGFATLLQAVAKPGAALTEELSGCASRIVHQARLMQKIILDFLDFQAMEDGQIKIVLEPVDLNEMTRLVLEQNAAYAESKGISLDSALDPNLPRVSADPNRIRQVVENFVSNAIKFSPPQTAVRAQTRPAENAVRVEIQDSGPGLSDEDMGKLFVKYAQLSNKPTGGEKSSGLGLAICKKVIDLHGGQIGARNNPGAGATFWFQLPLEAKPADK